MGSRGDVEKARHRAIELRLEEVADHGSTIANRESNSSNRPNNSISLPASPSMRISPAAIASGNVLWRPMILVRVARESVRAASAFGAKRPETYVSVEFSRLSVNFWSGSVNDQLTTTRLPSAFGPLRRTPRKSKNMSVDRADTMSPLTGFHFDVDTPLRNSCAPNR